MSPEQADSQGIAITAQSDLFSLGLIAFRLLVGRDYWGTGSIKEVITRILVAPMVPASARGSTLGPEFDSWFARACGREPAGRFTSAHEQVEALAEALELPTISRPGDSDARKSPRIVLATTLEAAPTLDASVTSATTTSSARGRPAVVMGLVIASAAGVALWLAARSPSQPAAERLTAEAPATSSAEPMLRESASVTASAPPPAPSSAPAASSAPSATPAVAAAPMDQRPLPTMKPTASTKARPAISAMPSGLPINPLAGQN